MTYKISALTALLCLFITCNCEAKKIHIENLNLTIDFNKNWTLREHPVAELALINITTGEVIVIHRQPLHSINAEEQIPNTFEEFKNYIKANFLKSQLNMLAAFFNETNEFHDDIEINGMKGPLIQLSGETKGIEMNFFMWMPWQGHGAYSLNYVSPKMLNRDKKDFKKLMKNIRITDDQINPFSNHSNIQLAENLEPIIDTQFNIQFNQFKDYISVDAAEMEISEDENFYNQMLVNRKNGDFISTIPHCFEMNTETQMLATKTFSQYILETTLYEDSFQSNGTDITYYKGSGVNEDIKQLNIQSSMKKIQDCYHLILVASSNRMDDSSNIKLVYENLNQLSDSEHQVKFYDQHKKTAYANYLIGIAAEVAESGVDALPFFNAAYSINPSADILNLVLDNQNTNKEFLKGIGLINQANDSIKNQPSILSWHAWFLSQTEAYEDAIKIYSELFAQTYTSDEDLFIFSDLLQNNSNWDLAYKLLDTHLASITKRSTGLGMMVKYAGFNNDEQATQDVLKIIKDENRLNLENVYDVLDGLYEVEANEQVIKILDDQIRQHPETLRLHYYKADIQFSWGQFQESLNSIEKAVALSPDNEDVQELLKKIQLNVGVGNYQAINNPIAAVETPREIRKKINNLAFKNQGDAEYLFYSVGINYEKNKKLKTTYSRKIKINNLKGVEHFKTITFDYDQSYENAYINNFEVLDDKNKVIQKLDIQSVYLSTNQDGITADDDMVINIPVPKLSEGMVISYDITTETKAPQSELPYSKHYFLTSFPMSMKTVFLTGDLNAIKGLSKEKLNMTQNNKFLSWSSGDITLMSYYPMMPYTEDISNWLILNPEDKTWQGVGDYYLNAINKKLKTPITKAKKLAIFSGAQSNEEKIIKAANFIQKNINYQALEFGTRAMIPNTSEETLKKGYGDCKDHAVLLYDLLISEGIKAQIALVQTSQLVNPMTPSLDQFDHAVVYLPDFNDGVYVDTTDKDLGILRKLPPQNLQGTEALILTSNASYLKTIPNAESKNSQIIIDRQITKDLSHINISETIQMTGYMGSGMRNSLKSNKSSELIQNVQSWLAGEYSDLELVSFDYYGLGDIQNPLIIEMNTRIDTEEYDTGLPYFFEKNYLNKNHSKKRDLPFFLNTPFELISETKIDPTLTINTNIPETTVENNSTVEWLININNNQVKFKAKNIWSQGTAEAYGEYVKTIKNGLKTLEKSISIID